jgi:hypothetical protein
MVRTGEVGQQLEQFNRVSRMSKGTDGYDWPSGTAESEPKQDDEDEDVEVLGQEVVRSSRIRRTERFYWRQKEEPLNTDGRRKFLGLFWLLAVVPEC